MDIISQYSSRDFYRSLHWRFAAARAAVEDGQPVVADDPALIEILAYERAIDRARSDGDIRRIGRKWPGIAAAHQFSTTACPLRSEVEARILGGEDDAAIAAKCCMAPQTIHWYEATFYSVRDRLQARDWIVAWAIDPDGKGGEARLWRAIAYGGGPMALEVVLSVARGTPLPAWVMPTQDCDWPACEAQLRLLARLVVAADMAQTPAELLDLIAEYEQAARADRVRFGDAVILRDDLHGPRLVLDLAAARSQRKSRNKYRMPKLVVDADVETRRPRCAENVMA